MIGIIKRFFLDKWRSLLIYIASSLAFSEMYVALYPTLRDQLTNLEGFLDAFPKEFMEAFGFTAETLSFETVESLMATEMFSMIWPIILIILAVSLANHAMAADVENGTIELTLAQPISRVRVFFSRYLAGASLIALFVVTTVFGIIPLTMIHGIDYNLDAYVLTAVLGSLFGLTIYSMATMASAAVSQKGRATFACVGVLISMYAVNVVSGLEDSLENLKYTSFFYYFDTGKALVRVEYVDWALWVFAGLIIAFTLLGALIFSKRDIAV